MAKRKTKAKPKIKPQPVVQRSVLPLGKSFPPEPKKPKRVKLKPKMTAEDQQKAAAIYYSHAHQFGA